MQFGLSTLVLSFSPKWFDAVQGNLVISTPLKNLLNSILYRRSPPWKTYYLTAMQQQQPTPQKRWMSEEQGKKRKSSVLSAF